MNSNDFEDIFLDNEKTSFQNNIGNMIEEPHPNTQASSIQIPENNMRPQAFPQDNYAFAHFSRQPEWSKKLPGLSGFVTLGNPIGFGENHPMGIVEFESMDIPSLAHQDFNFNLGRIFDENDSHEFARRASGMGIHLDTHHNQAQNHLLQNDKGIRRQSMHGRKHSKSNEKFMMGGDSHGQGQVQDGKMSFFKEYLPMLLEHHWKEILEHSTRFFEFEKSFDCHKNCENLMFLEEHKETYGNSFENMYHNHYLKIINQLREGIESFSLTGETILKIMYDSFCSLFSDLFNFIKNCTSEYCFDLMKNKTNTAKAARSNFQVNNPQESQQSQSRVFVQQQQQPSHNNNWESSEIEENKGEHSQSSHLIRSEANGGMHIEKLESLSHLIDVNVGRKAELLPSNKTGGGLSSQFSLRGLDSNVSSSEIESVASGDTRKFQRKYWSAAELQELDNLANQYYPNSIPIEKLEEFARRYSRTLNAVQSKISKTKKEKVKRQTTGNFHVDMVANGGPRNDTASSQRRYEVTVEKMIKGALQQFPDNTATKEEIIHKIKEMYFRDGMEGNDERLKNSISQTLSSSKGIGVIKGTYGLKSRDYIILDPVNAKTMKSRLQYILSNVPNYHLDIITIRRLYWENFFDSVDNDKVWETSITKILKQSQEFDTSHCKTKYALLLRDPLPI